MQKRKKLGRVRGARVRFDELTGNPFELGRAARTRRLPAIRPAKLRIIQAKQVQSPKSNVQSQLSLASTLDIPA
jgi:hypothetical protein